MSLNYVVILTFIAQQAEGKMEMCPMNGIKCNMPDIKLHLSVC